MSKKRNALGRGLSALLSDTTESEKLDESTPVASTSGVNEILLSEIQVNPFQPRKHFDETALKELSESIKVHGIIQPLTVRKLSKNEYQLISGERRFQASKMLD